MMLRKITLFCIAFLLLPAIQADPATETADFPTVTALSETHVPPADPVHLAQRFLGVGEIIADPVVFPALGDRQVFSTTNSSAGYTFEVEAELRVVGEHVYLWVQNDADVAQDGLESLARTWDRHIYPDVRKLWGSEASPGVDGDPRIHVLFARDLGATTAAYFARRHTYPDEVFVNSNEREMFFVNLDAYGMVIDGPTLASTMAHEFQHMIRDNVDSNEDTWLNEGFSTFTELYLGYDSANWLAGAFLPYPQTQLNTFGETNSARAVNYGAGFMFVTYLYERYGLEAIQQLNQSPVDGLFSIDEVLREMGEPGADDFFADWVLANLLQQPGSRYGYDLISMPDRVPVMTFNGQTTQTLPQYATDYYRVPDINGGQILEITLALPETVGLIPTEAYSGEQMWYSHRGDGSHMALEQAFDLRDVESATLSYRAWYSIEENWDYAYVTVSVDGGATWGILTTPASTTANPFGNAYGPGYTGQSDGWIEQIIALDAYAGHEILLRFEMVTDDAINQPGLALDDIAIPEIGYISDFETDNGGWQPQGWLWMDNRLPQRAWVQVIQIMPDDVHVDRWLVPIDALKPVELRDGVEDVLIAVSPLAPVTTVPTTYTLSVDVR